MERILNRFHKGCKEGYTRRRSYVRKNGVSVREACVPKSTQHKEQSQSQTRKNKRTGQYISCPEGDIPKSSYVRKGLPGHPPIYVPPTCMRGVSRIGILRRGDLKKYGYRYDLPLEARRKSLEKAIKHYGVLETWQKLNAIANISKTTNPVPASVFQQDAAWVLGIYNEQKKKQMM